MSPRKAADPATAKTVREAHGIARAGRLKRPQATPSDYAFQGLAVYDGQTCVGFLLPRGKVGFEAFDAADKSLGTFPDMKSAADAVCEAMS